MPSSDFELNRDEIIRAAFRRIGIKTLTPNHIQYGAIALHIYMQELDPSGLFLWKESLTESSITLSSGNRTYTADESPAANEIPDNILSLKRFELYSNGIYEDELTILTHDEARKTVHREGTGRPVECYLEVKADLTDSKLHVFPTPDATYTGKFTFREALTEFAGAAEYPNAPKHWTNALRLGTAFILGGEYGAPDHEMIKLERDEAQILAFKRSEPPQRPSRRQKMENF